MTLRDEVWHATLRQIVKTGSFRISDLPFNDSQRFTVRRVLREMEDLGWLERENDRAATWRLGDKAESHLNVSVETIKQGRT